MKYLLILVSLCMGVVSYGQIKKPGFLSFGDGTGSTYYSSYGGKIGRIIDSARGRHYWLYNSKRVPEKGLYADTCIWKEPLGTLYIVSIFYNQEQIANISYYRLRGDDSYSQIWIDPKIKPKHK